MNKGEFDMERALGELLERVKEQRLVATSRKFFPYLEHLAYQAKLRVVGQDFAARVDRNLNVEFGLWALRYSPEELRGVFLHELYHPLVGTVPGEPRWEAMLGMARRAGFGEREAHEFANTAADYAINSSLRRGGVALPEDGLFPEKHGLPPGLTAEEYMELVLRRALVEKAKMEARQGREAPQNGERAGGENPEDQAPETFPSSQGVGNQAGEERGPATSGNRGGEEGQEGETSPSQGAGGQTGEERDPTTSGNQGSGEGRKGEASSPQGAGGQAGETSASPQGSSGDEAGGDRGDGGTSSGRDLAGRGRSAGEATAPSGEPQEGGMGNEAFGEHIRSILEGRYQPLEEAVEPPEGEEGPPLEAIRREVARRIQEHHKTRGNVPGDLLRLAEEILAPKVPWQSLLRAALSQALAPFRGNAYRTFAVMHRRDPFLEVRLPGGRAVLPRVALVVDTSGSMSDEELSQALAEVKRILSLGTQLTVYSVDAEVHGGAQRVRSYRQVRLEGGGGTDMRVGIQEALRARPLPDLLVVFTDGYTPWPESPPPVRTVVVCTTDHPVPEWARVVRVKV